MLFQTIWPVNIVSIFEYLFIINSINDNSNFMAAKMAEDRGTHYKYLLDNYLLLTFYFLC